MPITRPEKKNEWINNETKPTIAELENILNDRGEEMCKIGK